MADLTFTALPGETIALVGAPGPASRPRWRCCTAPSIRNPAPFMIDGMDIREVKLSALRRNIGVVFQETLLLNRSIAENLQVAKPDATEQEMREAPSRAQALDFVERAPRLAHRSGNAADRSRAANASGCRSRAHC